MLSLETVAVYDCNFLSVTIPHCYNALKNCLAPPPPPTCCLKLQRYITKKTAIKHLQEMYKCRHQSYESFLFPFISVFVFFHLRKEAMVYV